MNCPTPRRMTRRRFVCAAALWAAGACLGRAGPARGAQHGSPRGLHQCSGRGSRRREEGHATAKRKARPLCEVPGHALCLLCGYLGHQDLEGVRAVGRHAVHRPQKTSRLREPERHVAFAADHGQGHAPLKALGSLKHPVASYRRFWSMRSAHAAPGFGREAYLPSEPPHRAIHCGCI